MDESIFFQRLFAATVAVLAFAVAYAMYGKLIRSKAPSTDGLSLETTVGEIKQALVRLENTPGVRLGLELTEVKIELLVTGSATQTGSAGLSIPVFSDSEIAGTVKVDEKRGSKVTVVLVPPDGSQILSADWDAQIDFASVLRGIRRELVATMTREPKLDAKSIKVDMSFVLIRTEESNASVKAHFLGVTSTVGNETSASNSISLLYKNPSYSESVKDVPSGPVPP